MELRPCSIKYINLHHTAGNEKNTQAVRQIHLNQGWGDIGYNAVIEPDGTVGIGRDIKYSGAHNPGRAPDGNGYTMNQRAYAISHIGNFEIKTMPEVQFQSSVKHCAQKCKEFGIVPSKVTIRRHGDDYPTACPGKNFPYERYVAEVIKLYNRGGDDEMLDKFVIYADGDIGAAITFSQSEGCPMVRSTEKDLETVVKKYPAKMIYFFGFEGKDTSDRKYFKGKDRKETAKEALK